MKIFTQVNNSRDVMSMFSGLKSRIDSLYSRNWTIIAPMLFVVFGLFGVNENAWGNSTSYSGTGLNKNGSWSLNHGTFTISGGSYVDNEWKLCSLNKNNTQTFNIGWSSNEGTSITVTNITFSMLGYGTSSQVRAKFTGQNYKNIGSTIGATTNVSISNPESDLTLTVTCSANISRDIRIKSMKIDYTITPNAPGVSPTTASIDVTLNTNDKKTVNLTNYFSVSDETDFRSLVTYSQSSGSIDGTNFYATDSGTYTVNAYIAAKKDCHEKSATSSNLTITVNPFDADFNTSNGSVEWSDNTKVNIIDLRTLVSGYNGNGSVSFSKVTKSGYANVSNATIASDGYSFSATTIGTYRIKATYAATKQYRGVSKEFDVVVGKRTPTFSWWNENGGTHIYAGDTLKNVAQAKYNGNNVAGLTYHYSSSNTTLAVVDGTNIRVPSTGFTSAGTTTITVTTDSTSYYKAGEATHNYYIEPKATPLFKLNDVDLPESPIEELSLLIGETANMTFENTDESNGQFTYPTTPKYVTYTHDSEHHSGVIEGKAAGDEYIQFQQTGTTTIFGHTRSIHVYVHKHAVELTTPMGGTWKVDSIYGGTLYSLSDTPEGEEPEQNDVTISSSDKSVVDFVDGHWKAVGAGEATLTIAQKNNDYWTGDTIITTITVEKYTPVITWNLESSYAWGSQISNPVSSTCELPFTLTSSDPSKADYVNGKIEVYNKNGNVTFTLTQTGNYKWTNATSNTTFTFNCFKPANHLPMDLKAGNYSQYKSYTTNNVSWSNSGVQCGTSGGGFNWDDKYIELHVTGVPHHLTFNYQTNNNVLGDPSGVEWFVQYKTATGDWSAKTTWNDNSGSKDFVLDPDVQYVRLCYSGNYGGLFTNVNITERKEIVAPASVTFPTNSVDASANTQTINVNWYNVKHSAVTITGTNASFFSLADDSHEIASTIDDYGTKALKVSYAYPEGGTHTATLHIESEDGYTANVPLSATSNKLTPAITWKENLTPMSRGENVVNPASSPVTLVYESSDSTVVDVEGNTLKPLKKGEATITASFDGTTDKKYNSNSSTIDVLVTDMKVLHINWPQTFTRLKYSAEKPEKTTADFALTATVSYFDPDTKEEISIDRAVTFTSSNNAVVQVLSGNILHVVGLGTTATLTAHVDGVENEFIEANVVRAVKVREPSTDCDTYILEDAHNSMLTEINSFNGVETEYALSGEPGYLTFSAWTEKWYLGKLGIDPSGDMKVAQYVDGEWSDAIWSNSLQVGVEQPFGPIALDRRATKIKFYKEVGSTCYHNFSEGYVTLARYVELENTPNKATLDIAFNTEETKPGVAVVKTFTVNYSNITDQLVIDYEGSNKFSILSPVSKTIGEECGDKGTATVQVQFLSDDVDYYEGVITIHNENQSVTINLSADVDKHHQQIEWNPETLSLKTTDDVTFDATTTGSAANLSVTYVVTNGDAATVNAETGKLTIITEGEVTIEARCEGNSKYYDAEPVPYTFHIDKVTPEITTAPAAATMTMPNTNLGSCGLTGGVATVAGSFAWADNTINATLNNEGYTVVFTPENTNWYNTATCTVVVPVNKQVNEITWNFNVPEMYCNADYTFNAYATSGLDVRYETSDDKVAYVDGENHLSIIKGGEVTITAYEDGDEDWDAATPVSKTFTILRFTPEIKTLPTASSILIGQLLDNASLTDGLAELNGAQVDGGFAWVDGHTTTMNVAGEFIKDIVFNPSNANWYEQVYGTMTVVVEKYAPTILTNTLTASSIEFPNTLSTSVLSGTVTAEDQVKYPSVPVTGHVEWKTPTTILRPGMQTGIALFVPDNIDWYTSVEIPVSVQVTGGYVFNGDNTNWTEEDNWVGNLIPGTDDPVLINEDVDITTSVTVGSLTIAENVDLVVKNGGVLTIGDYDSEDRETYGNLYVENGGQVIFGAGEVQVNDFTLEAELGDTENLGKSGQVHNPATLKVNGNAYFDLALDPTKECTYGWYDFTVPFPVNALTGVSRFNRLTGEEVAITNEVHYAIMDFSETRRLETGYGWKKFRGVMQPGQCYSITTNNEDYIYRFKKTSDGVFNNVLSETLAYTETDNAVRGWNGLGNGTMSYVNLSAEGIEKVQVYNHSTNSYTAVPMDTFTYVVGSAYFIQAPSISSVLNYTHGGDTHVLRAPSRTEKVIEEFALALTAEDNHVNDRFYVSASVDATDTYRIGRELTKFGTPTDSKVAQVWTNAYGMQLCDIEMPLLVNKANTNISFFAPQNGLYTLEVEKAPADATMYLTKNGKAIWNLSMSPYDLDLSKGTTEGYGLRIVAREQTTTDIEQSEYSDQSSVRKVMIDNVIYIVTPEGKMYDIIGKSVNF